MKFPYLGAHVSLDEKCLQFDKSESGKTCLCKVLIHAKNRGFTAIQIHPTAPVRWTYSSIDPHLMDEFNEQLPISEVKKVFFHGIYLINLAGTEEKNLKLSVKSLIEYIKTIETIKLNPADKGVIFHLGTSKYWPEEQIGEAYKQIAALLTEVLNATESGRLLLENAAGSGRVIGSDFKDLGEIYNLLSSEHQSRIGFCLDTQHMFASGYSLSTTQEEVRETKGKIKTSSLAETLSEIHKNLVSENIYAIHCNDSQSDFASNIDRHQIVGTGNIGGKKLRDFLENFNETPIVLETPNNMDLSRSSILQSLECAE